MTRKECLKASALVCRAFGFASFEEMKDLVIMKGFLNSGLESRYHWNQVERGFHTAQFLQWAGEEQNEKRAYWVEAASKRLPPMSFERWQTMPKELRALAA